MKEEGGERGRGAADRGTLARHDLVTRGERITKGERIDAGKTTLLCMEIEQLSSSRDIEQHEREEEVGVCISGILRVQESCLLLGWG